jgi:hypothetical protein
MNRTTHAASPSGRTSLAKRKLLFQPLEPRLLMAGDITATVIDGRLTIIGDDAANEVFVGDLGGGRFALRGITGNTGSPTTINGQADWIAENVSGDVAVDLGGGNDLFYLVADSDWNGGSPFEQTWQQGGFAPLFSNHSYAHVQGQLSVNLGDGNDTAVIAASAADGITIVGGADAGDDGLFVRTHHLRTTKSLEIGLGEGNDYAAVSMNGIADFVAISGGAGNDTLLVKDRTAVSVGVDLGGGDDRLTYQGEYYGTGWGNSAGAVNNSGRAVEVLGGDGNDLLTVEMIRAGRLTVDAGSGRDSVLVRGIDIRDDVVVRGGGALGSHTTVTDYTKLDGGAIDSTVATANVVYIRTRIGGNLTVNNNYDAPVGNSTNDIYSVFVGATRSFSEGGFQVGGALRAYGTIFNDNLNVQLVQAGQLAIDAGWGSDAITVRGVNVVGNVSLLLGDGDDRGLIVSDYTRYEYQNNVWTDTKDYTPTHIGGELLVNYGAGDEMSANSHDGDSASDRFMIGASYSGLTRNFVVAGNLQVIGGEGRNQLEIVAATLGSADLRFNGEQSLLEMKVFRVAGNLTVTGAAGHDTWLVNAFGVGGDILLSSGAGQDWILLNQQLHLVSDSQGRLHIDAGSGNDTVEVGGVSSPGNILVRKDVVVETGDGDDRVNLSINATDMLLTLLGSGDDQLLFREVSMNSALVDGGAGNDRLDGTYGEQVNIEKLRRSNFESGSLTRHTNTVTFL